MNVSYLSSIQIRLIPHEELPVDITEAFQQVTKKFRIYILHYHWKLLSTADTIFFLLVKIILTNNFMKKIS